MPLLRFDIIAGRTEDELKALLDAAHDVVVEVFKVPPRDRYQIVHEHPPAQIVAEDTGLGFDRTRRFVLLQMTTRPRSLQEKQHFYAGLCRALETKCDIVPTDIMVSLVETSDADWSFGLGEAQFVTGTLGGGRTARNI